MKYPVGTRFRLGGAEWEIKEHNSGFYCIKDSFTGDVLSIHFYIFDRFNLEIIEPEVTFTKAQADAIFTAFTTHPYLTGNFHKWLDAHTDKE